MPGIRAKSVRAVTGHGREIVTVAQLRQVPLEDEDADAETLVALPGIVRPSPASRFVWLSQS